MQIILVTLYLILGYKSIGYCKHHIIHIKYELVNDIAMHLFMTLFWGVVLGIITIPTMILHKIFFNRNK